ncbi:hypothetical protein EV368DRAFT_69270 [Lentinula lateritia]|nr:hypothetical protein EV368DRAFT_69270 [Lentinula lateritia]
MDMEQWALPGGHLEAGESFEDCAAPTNDVMVAENKHYVTIWVACEMVDHQAVAENLEPEKCEVWEWVTWEELKRWAKLEVVERTDPGYRALFLPLLNIVAQRPDFEGPVSAD